MNLTPHFTLEEFVNSQTAARRGIDNKPTPKQLENIKRTAEMLEDIRNILNNHPILISSGYRNEWLNTAIGGAKKSAHTHGLAADFICPGFGPPLAVCQELEPHLAELGVDQLIYEFATWVHMGLVGNDKPRHQALTIDKRGARNGFG